MINLIGTYYFFLKDNKDKSRTNMATRFLNHHWSQYSDMKQMDDSKGEPLFGNISWKHYLATIDVDSARASQLIEELSQCSCCERHQIDRPTELCHVTCSKVPPVPTPILMPACQCACRHHIRQICRIFHT